MHLAIWFLVTLWNSASRNPSPDVHPWTWTISVSQMNLLWFVIAAESRPIERIKVLPVKSSGNLTFTTLFLVILIFFIRKTVIEKQGDTDFFSCTGSLPTAFAACKHWISFSFFSWNRMISRAELIKSWKPGASFLLSLGCMGPRTWATLCCFPRP